MQVREVDCPQMKGVGMGARMFRVVCGSAMRDEHDEVNDYCRRSSKRGSGHVVLTPRQSSFTVAAPRRPGVQLGNSLPAARVSASLVYAPCLKHGYVLEGRT